MTEAALKRQERPALSGSGLDRDPRPPHDRQRQILQAAIAGIAADRTAKSEVKHAGRRGRIAKPAAIPGRRNKRAVIVFKGIAARKERRVRGEAS
jgi:hypothetical protein